MLLPISSGISGFSSPYATRGPGQAPTMQSMVLFQCCPSRRTLPPRPQAASRPPVLPGVWATGKKAPKLKARYLSLAEPKHPAACATSTPRPLQTLDVSTISSTFPSPQLLDLISSYHGCCFHPNISNPSDPCHTGPFYLQDLDYREPVCQVPCLSTQSQQEHQQLFLTSFVQKAFLCTY